MNAEEPRTYTVENREWWENLYQSKTTPWELGEAAPPFKSFLNSPYCVPPGKMLIPGCGTGNECLLFASHGFEVTGLDFAPSAAQATGRRLQAAGLLGTKGFLLQRDVFDIHEYDGYFDYVLEHTCYCAIHPTRRHTYAMTVRDLLKPGGKLIGLWWLLDHGKGGPPYSLDKTELFTTFQQFFNIDLAYIPGDSVPERKGKELFTVMTVL